MKSLRQNVWELIPIDLIIEIFSLLPAKSIARCRCVSKLWSSILVRQDFTELFLTKSSSYPQLLFIFRKNDELFFFSTPQPQNPLDENPSPMAATFHMKIPYNYPLEDVSPMRGLIFLRHLKLIEGNWNIVTMTCNPSTRQSLVFPQVKTRCFEAQPISYNGYDPVEKQFKVLSMKTLCDEEMVSKEHQVLTLGSGEWRKIECCIPHYPLGKGICINGVIYYLAFINSPSRDYMIVCFDVRSEKFTSIQATETYLKLWSTGFLINYNGKLGLLAAQGSSHVPPGYFEGGTWSFKLCVLENVEKNEWSENTYIPSPSYREIVGDIISSFVGVTQANEIVLSPVYLSSTRPLYIVYYNIERNTFRRVEIQGMEACKDSQVYTVLDHVENVKLMQMVLL